ncbi:MAG: hypothetical protein COY40_05395 [Alphaproteobacteria bacterium CG_4_10_14_0_8_um_filter_53_9]|nr:MAG: hypothetical protein COY40_05395 [Alphaproteobacteria bacterium CG_4_10_14_0_8_um_filter_53_9]
MPGGNATMNPWGDNAEVIPPELEAQRDALARLPENLLWAARAHYWVTIYQRGHIPEKILVVHSFCWRTGEHLYFVPVMHARDMADAYKRHDVQRGEGVEAYMTSFYELHWSEFERRFSPPADMTAASQFLRQQKA